MPFTITRCPSCNNTYLQDVDICPVCLNVTPTVREEIPGTGKIYTFTRVHVAPEQFKNIVPYYLAIVDLDHGPRVMGRIEVTEGDHVRIDAPVEINSVERGNTFSLK